jgi:tetratricopeptide (TPR) repeat protein
MALTHARLATLTLAAALTAPLAVAQVDPASPASPVSPASPASPASQAAALRGRALELGYNLDHDEALAAFRAAMAADPTDPAPYRLIAATEWINLLFRQGAVTADDYLGQARTELARTPPSPQVEAIFRTNIETALALTERRLHDNPADADAHYQLGAAHGFLATYKATVEGRVVGSIGSARRAYNEHERVLQRDPKRKEAGLIVGMYRYGVSLLPAPLRLLAGLAGFGGGRERGLRLIEEAAAYPSEVQANAKFTLIVIYNREKRYDDALRVVRELQRQYPRNRLLWLEAASTSLRAGRPEDARAAIDDGLARFAGDSRPRAFGEPARWRYYRGAALVALRQVDLARPELQSVLSADAPDWLRGRAHTELGKLADLSGDGARAAEEYRLAERLCRATHDEDGATEAKTLVKTHYR